MTNQQPGIEAIKARADAATGTASATRHELAQAARRNYEENLHAAGVQGVWTSTIGHAIDAWEREPTLLTIIAQQQEEIGRYKEALGRWATHSFACSSLRRYGPRAKDRTPHPCDCGFAEIEALLHPQAGQEGASEGERADGR